MHAEIAGQYASDADKGAAAQTYALLAVANAINELARAVEQLNETKGERRARP